MCLYITKELSAYSACNKLCYVEDYFEYIICTAFMDYSTENFENGLSGSMAQTERSSAY